MCWVSRDGHGGLLGPRRLGSGLGLGFFIAKTLLERSGAELTFANGFDSVSEQDSHADRTGSKEYNIQLSLQRARRVETWLKGQQLEIIKEL